MRQTGSVEQPVDLDAVVAAIAARSPAWKALGLTVGEPTWNDAVASWLQHLETDRSLDVRTESVGVRLIGSE
jgi:hypothetical protein